MAKLRYAIFLFVTHWLSGLTTLNVSLSTDNNPGGMGDVGDLRYAINTMNQNLNSMADDYAITFDFPMTIQLNGILPIINNSPNPVSITIGNPGSIPTVTIDGNSGSYPGFFVATGNVTIQNIIFQNLAAKGGNGGDGISGGGGGMGAGAAIYAPQSFLYGSNPSITLSNVLVNSCSAIGGNGGNSSLLATSGNEGGGGGGGLYGNGGSITTTGITGGGGAGGLGGDGGNVTLSTSDPVGGGGGGGGGIGSRATTGTITNLCNGGSDDTVGVDGNGYGLSITGGSGGGGKIGGANAGGGGGGNALVAFGQTGGGGGGSLGSDGLPPQGAIPPGGSATPSGGNGGDGAGGGGGAGTGASDASYSSQGGSGGVGGGGGGGGVDQSGTTSAQGGSSLGGGGGGGAGPSSGIVAQGGTDIGNLGGGTGGSGSDSYGAGFAGGGGGGGSGLGGAIFVDSNLNLTIQAISGIPTIFDTPNCTVQAGIGGTGGTGGTNGADGSAAGPSIFLRTNSSVSCVAENSSDILTLGENVSFTDDTAFGAGGTAIRVTGNGTVVYNGTTDYQGSITVNNANFKVNGLINTAPVSVCRNSSFSSQRGTLSGSGSVTGPVFVNSGVISPDIGQTLSLGSLTLSAANPMSGTIGSVVHINIDSNGPSVVQVNGPATLAGTLEITIDPTANPGSYVILTSSGITNIFDLVTFTGPTPNYTISYLPENNPTYVQFNFAGFAPAVLPPSSIRGIQMKNNFGFEYELYNQIWWQPSATPDIASYILYRNGQFLTQVSPYTLCYQDHNQPQCNRSLYAIAAVDRSGTISSTTTVTIPSR